MWKNNCEKRTKYYDEVIRLYTQEGMGRSKIAKIFPIGESTISRRIRNFASETKAKEKGKRFTNTDLVIEAVRAAVAFYNEERPHMSVDMMTPHEAALCVGKITKRWTKNSVLTTNSQLLSVIKFICCFLDSSGTLCQCHV